MQLVSRLVLFTIIWKERAKYIIKDAKQYLITQDGWEILREIDVKSPDVRKDERSESDDQHA